MRTGALLIALAICLFAQSQPPVPTPPKTAQEEQNKSTPQKSKTNHDSRLPHGLNSEITTLEQQQNSLRNQEKPPTDWWAVINTGLLTLFTGTLAYLAHKQREAMDKQALYMRNGLDLTRETVETAKLSAEAAFASANTAKMALQVAERADVLVERIDLLNDDGPSIATVFSVAIRNFGRTRAIDLDLTFSLTTEGSEEAKVRKVTMALGPETSLDIPFTGADRWTTQTALQKVRSGALSLHFAAQIAYRDVFQKEHTTVAEGIYNRNIGRFEITHNTVE